jgi:hypothetical protein
MTGRQGEHLVSAFLFELGWQSNIVDAMGYDIIATREATVLRVQVKSSSRPVAERGKLIRKYVFSVGVGGKKSIDDLENYYDMLALCGLADRGIKFFPAPEVTAKTIRIRPEEFGLDDALARHSWERAVKMLKEK